MIGQVNVLTKYLSDSRVLTGTCVLQKIAMKLTISLYFFNFREDWKPVLTVNSIVYGLQYLFLVSTSVCIM